MDHFIDTRCIRSIFVEGDSGVPALTEWTKIRDVLMKALWPFDEARRAVREALSAIGRMPVDSPE